MSLSLIIQLICLGVQVPMMLWLFLSLMWDEEAPFAVFGLAVALGPVNVLFMILGKVFGF